jgi:hypothetical protein
MGMRKTAVLLASIVLAVLLATGVALAQSIRSYLINAEAGI